MYHPLFLTQFIALLSQVSSLTLPALSPESLQFKLFLLPPDSHICMLLMAF